jgi:hypothetical protein
MSPNGLQEAESVIVAIHQSTFTAKECSREAVVNIEKMFSHSAAHSSRRMVSTVQRTAFSMLFPPGDGEGGSGEERARRTAAG